MPRFKYNRIKIGGRIFQQVTKKKAHYLYSEGKAIYVQGCNANLHSPWISLIKFVKNPDTMMFDEYIDELETLTNAFIYYLPEELGKRPIFFKEELE